jgi:hypothetical protein
MSEFMEAHRKLLEDELRLVEKLERESSRFQFTASGSPPNCYDVTFRCKGIVGFAGDQPQISEEHKARIILHPDYPLAEDAMEIQWLTQIFHPNIDRMNGPCIKGTPLGTNIRVSEICEFLAAMIQYNTYNIYNHWKTPEAEQAARWARDNPGALPLDSRPLRDSVGRRVMAGDRFEEEG